jgi:hypothetical protein
VSLGDLPAGEPNTDSSIQPARAGRQARQQRLAEEQAFTAWGNRAEPQFASLIPPMQHNSPGEGRALVVIPIQHSDELLA